MKTSTIKIADGKVFLEGEEVAAFVQDGDIPELQRLEVHEGSHLLFDDALAFLAATVKPEQLVEAMNRSMSIRRLE